MPSQGAEITPNLDLKNRDNWNNCFIAGWGQMGTSGRFPQSLQSKNVDIMSDEFCRAHMDNRQERVFFPEKEFCAGEGVSSAFCVGDAGGPLICIEDGKPVQYGIASYTLKCGQTGFPGIYVPVSRYIDWMDEIILGTDNVDNNNLYNNDNY